MRLLATLASSEDVHKISTYLTSQKIENKVDVETGTDWGSDHYGTNLYRIWIIDEDKTEAATQIFNTFENDPRHLRYNPPPLKVIISKKKEAKPKMQNNRITLFIISICAFFFALTAFTSSGSLIYTSPVKQKLLYDFPKSYEILNTLVKKFGIEALQDTQKLPPEGNALVQEFKATPSWQGFYEEALLYFSKGETPPKAPWFEKIKEGELWRLVSPIFLHGDIFHILFNMAWVYILGKQLEMQLQPIRYILFILLSAIVTNTAQYLISGPNFIGFSGVICAMLSFIWMRQKNAPWEGYQIQKSTFNFMMIFIFGMLALQSLSFVVEIFTEQTISTSIANGAHIFGLLTGWVFAYIPFFTHKRDL